jgi:hypothetical protein
MCVNIVKMPIHLVCASLDAESLLPQIDIKFSPAARSRLAARWIWVNPRVSDADAHF